MSAIDRLGGARVLLRVELRHEYFGAAAFTAFKVTPLPGTITACRRLGLQLARSASGLALFDLGLRAGTSAAERARSAVSLCWEITPNSAEFAAFTAVEFSGANQCLVLTPRTVDAAGGLLTSGALAGDDDVWPRRPRRFDFRLDEQDETTKASDSAIAADLERGDFVPVAAEVIAVDLSGCSSGLYRCALPGRQPRTWFVDERGRFVAHAGATLALPARFVSALLAQPPADQPDSASVPVYTARFPAREVLWRYHIFNAPENTKMSIVPGDPVESATAEMSAPMEFRPLEKPLLSDACTFTATTRRKLQHRSADRYVLQCGPGARPVALPNAGLAFGRSAGEAPFCSDIFVHL